MKNIIILIIVSTVGIILLAVSISFIPTQIIRWYPLTRIFCVEKKSWGFEDPEKFCMQTTPIKNQR